MYGSQPLLTYKLYCSSKIDTLNPKATQVTVLAERYMGNFMSLLSSTDFSFEIVVLKNIFQECEQSAKQYGSR